MQSNSPQTEDPKVWSIAVNKKPEGPYSKADLRGMFEAETITEDQKVWKKGMANWLKAKEVPEIAAIKEEVDLARVPKARWHVAIKGKPQGPFTDSDIEEKFMSGEIEEKNKMWRNGQTDWKPMSQIDELAPMRERVAAHKVASMPPPLMEESEGPPPLIEEPAPAPVKPAAPVQAKAVVSEPVVVKAQPVAEVKAEVVKPTKPEIPLNDHGTASMRQIDDLAKDVKKLYPQDPKMSAAIDQIKGSLKKSFLTGDPFGLDESLGGLNNLIHVAHSKSTTGYNVDMQKAGQALVDVHGKGAHQVANVNFENQLPSRYRFLFGLDAKAAWSVAPRM